MMRNSSACSRKKKVQSLIDMAVVTDVGDGTNTLFWKDRWINGQRISDIASSVYAMVPKRVINKQKVSEALMNLQWMSDFQGALSFQVLQDYLELYQQLEQVVLQPGTLDTHLRRLSALG
jgi:hypothetical protein